MRTRLAWRAAHLAVKMATMRSLSGFIASSGIERKSSRLQGRGRGGRGSATHATQHNSHRLCVLCGRRDPRDFAAAGAVEALESGVQAVDLVRRNCWPGWRGAGAGALSDAADAAEAPATTNIQCLCSAAQSPRARARRLTTRPPSRQQRGGGWGVGDFAKA